MSVLMEIAMFPTDVGESKSRYVAEVLKVIKDSGFEYQLTPMATIIEADNIKELTDLIPKMYEALEKMGVGRVYSVVKFDIRPGKKDRLKQKVKSVEKRLNIG
ncbi:MTH1187 family thiamine-binding protein [Nitrosophilus kaiyonis]|uniref:MTH1187 family thiamine-binding protein n=1 Tax=Nitrosophilus kaiyonis TaxID=2930200 RepID=UPI00248F9986|nr:MTH1187 family thiamine-binding protein [Nitrosophilus kaiyonis]